MTSDEILALQAMAEQRIARLRELPELLRGLRNDVPIYGARDYAKLDALDYAANAIEQMLEDIDAH